MTVYEQFLFAAARKSVESATTPQQRQARKAIWFCALYGNSTVMKGLEDMGKKVTKVDMVNHPPHYTQGDVECIDAIQAATINLTGEEAYCTGAIIKYMWRWKQKGGKQDLMKAAWYLQRLADALPDVED